MKPRFGDGPLLAFKKMLRPTDEERDDVYTGCGTSFPLLRRQTAQVGPLDQVRTHIGGSICPSCPSHDSQTCGH